MNPLSVKFACESPATNSQVIDRLNELETLIYSSSYNIVNQTEALYFVIQRIGRLLILCDTTSNSITIKLPKAKKNNTIIDIKKISGDSNQVTILPYGSETIDSGTEAIILVQDVSVEVVSDNNLNWYVI